MNHKSNEVTFTPNQLQLLEQQFPPVVLTANSTEAQMRHYFGTQAVLEYVRGKTRGLSSKVVQIGNDIPTPERSRP